MNPEIKAAEQALKRAIKSGRNVQAEQLKLAALLGQAGQAHKALAILTKLLKTRPEDVNALYLAGKVNAGLGRVEKALQHYRCALTHAPMVPDLVLEAAGLMVAELDFEAARECLEGALPAVAGWPPAARRVHHAQRAFVLSKLGRFPEAEALARDLLSDGAETPVDLMRLAGVLSGRDLAGEQEAIGLLRRGLAQQPDNPSLLYALATSLMRLGHYTEGLAAYRHRLRRPGDQTRIPDGPEWDGTPLDGDLLVYCEQGFGDALQFARFIAAAAERCAGLTVLCRPPLRRMFETVAGVDRVETKESRMPACAAKVSIIDLPHVMGPEVAVDTLWCGPYLPQSGSFDRSCLPGAGDGPQIGIVWAGNRMPDPYRSCPLAHFTGLAQRHGLCFSSLLVGPESSQLTAALADWVVDPAPARGDFLDTAALISTLDLVITIDTAVAHLAGGMGKECWLILPYVADWRWGFGDSKSDWYPDMRLFRQPEPRDWAGVFTQLDQALSSRFGAPAAG